MDKLLPLMRNLESGGYTQKVKHGCELLGIPVGIPRRPLLPLTDADRIEFERVFRIASLLNTKNTKYTKEFLKTLRDLCALRV